MIINVIGSGSSGNSYRIYDGKTALLLECGLPVKKIKEGCNFNFSNIAGCLCSHSHRDHSKSAEFLMLAGVEVYCSPETASECDLMSHRLHLLKPLVGVKIGSYEVFPFPVHHDVTCYGYLIYSYTTGEKLLFITDSAYTDYKFPGLNYVMLEVNYAEELIAGEPDAARLRRSHMSIENCVKMLKSNDLTAVKEIWLLHLSTRHGDSEEFRNTVRSETGCVTYIA